MNNFIVLISLLIIALIFTGCRKALKSNSKPFETVEGVTADVSGIKEEYFFTQNEEGQCRFVLNVSAQNISNFFLKISSLIDTNSFLFLEIPCNEKTELELRKKPTDPFHKDIFYLDGIDYKILKKLFSKYEDLLVNEGGVNFGYGANSEEVFITDYKIFNIYTKSPDKYHRLLSNLGMKQTEDFKTVWNNFTHNSPGRLTTVYGVDKVYEMINELGEKGLYFAERREQ